MLEKIRPEYESPIVGSKKGTYDHTPKQGKTKEYGSQGGTIPTLPRNIWMESSQSMRVGRSYLYM
jgi:hypothetical protein